MRTTTQTNAMLLAFLSAALLAAPFVASTGFFIIDEVIYVLGVFAFNSDHGFVVANGYSQFHSNDLTLMNLLAPGPDGLVPQYPVGTAIVGAPFYTVLGMRGLFLVNCLAGVGTLFVLRALTVQLFESERVAMVALLLFSVFSFAAEYTVGYWPHMVSVLSVTGSFLLFLRALDREKGAWTLACASGFALGLGLLFRIDGVLLLPPIAISTILFGARPFQIIFGGALGLLPSIATLSITNSFKFGTFNPLSYGNTDGGPVDPTSYIGLAVPVVFALAVLVVLRLFGSRITGTRWVWGGVVLAAVGALLVPALQKLGLSYVRGFHALFIDATWIEDPRPNVVATSNGTLLFWGMAKKALGQSMPWIGVVAALLTSSWGRYRRPISLVLIFAATWTFPFVIQSWHGGLGSNMRYFLPVLPALCALCAWIILEFVKKTDHVSRILILSGVIGVVAAVFWGVIAPSGSTGSQQILSTYIFLVVAVLSFLAGREQDYGAGVTRFALAGIGLGLGISLYNTGADISAAQTRRSALDTMGMQAQKVAGKVLFYGTPEIYVSSLAGESNLVALPHWESQKPDLDLVAGAVASGYRVLMPGNEADKVIAEREAFTTPDPARSDVPEWLTEITLR